MTAQPRKATRNRVVIDQPRLLPLSIAGAVCLLVAVVAGYCLWYFLDDKPQQALAPDLRATTQTSNQPPPPVETPTPILTTPPPPKTTIAPAGELRVPGGEVVLGGLDAGRPLRRVLVDPFAIGETEVTNQHYYEFVKETGRTPPGGWKNGEFPPGTADEPATGVTWQDANDYCEWLSRITGAAVRLPTEAEWQLAAGGKEGWRYPWGNEWNERAAVSAEGGGRVRPVKSYREGRSPCGAYDMAGNVWEWIADDVSTEGGQPLIVNGKKMRIAKGGAADESKDLVTATSRQEILETVKSRSLGFRYVVQRGRENREG